MEYSTTDYLTCCNATECSLNPDMMHPECSLNPDMMHPEYRGTKALQEIELGETLERI